MVNLERRVNVGAVGEGERCWLEQHAGRRVVLLGPRGEHFAGLMKALELADSGATVVVLLCATDVGDC